VNLPFITADASRPEAPQYTKLTRAKFEQLVEDLVARPSRPCKALKDAGLKVGEVDEVILVGGSDAHPAGAAGW
jgi:molecular chaperone DnaK